MKNLFLFLCLNISLATLAQKKDALINVKEVQRIEGVLAADAMQGRKAGTPASKKAAEFIAGEFKKAGIQPLQGQSFLQEFTMVSPVLKSIEAKIDDQEINDKEIIAITLQPELNIDENAGYSIEYVKAGQNIGARVQEIMGAGKNTVAFIDKSFAKMFPRLSGFSRPGFKSDEAAGNNVVFILGDYQPKAFKIQVKNDIEEVAMANVAAVLPGKTKPDEYVIFSAHYDHLGIGQPVNGDSIYNGANDDAAGTTAVIMLANYFKKQNNNARTLIFVTFTAEEIGGFGSQYFSKQLDPKSVMAMFNIEMIGTESKWGKNSAFITGYEKTDMGKILQENLKGTSFKFYPDPYPEQQLFYRSDNATLASLGVPAHTISTSKMDSEKYYHTVDDEIETLDMENMAAIIRAVALSSKAIVEGKSTPSRVDTSDAP